MIRFTVTEETANDLIREMRDWFVANVGMMISWQGKGQGPCGEKWLITYDFDKRTTWPRMSIIFEIFAEPEVEKKFQKEFMFRILELSS